MLVSIVVIFTDGQFTEIRANFYEVLRLGLELTDWFWDIHENLQSLF